MPRLIIIWVIRVLNKLWGLIHSFSCRDGLFLFPGTLHSLSSPPNVSAIPLTSSHSFPVSFQIVHICWKPKWRYAQELGPWHSSLYIPSFILHDHLPSHGSNGSLYLQDRSIPWGLDFYIQLPPHPLYLDIKHIVQAQHIQNESLDFLLNPAPPSSFPNIKWEEHFYSYLDPKLRLHCWFLSHTYPHTCKNEQVLLSPPSVYVPNLNSSYCILFHQTGPSHHYISPKCMWRLRNRSLLPPFPPLSP